MTTSPSSRHEVHVSGLPRARDRGRHGANGECAGVRSRSAAQPSAPSHTLTSGEAQVRATWAGTLGRCELTVRRVPPDLQVRQRTLLKAGGVLDEIFILHSVAEFDRWHSVSPTKFEHPVAHDELRRFAHASLSA